MVLTTIFIGLYPLSAYADTIVINNYYYAHANTTGTFYFKDKYGTEPMYGDNIQHDAVIQGAVISAQGLAVGDKIMLYTGSGESYEMTPGVQLSLNVAKTDYIKIAIVKAGNNEVYARLEDLYTFDDSDGGTYVHYTYSINDIPTHYGDLGPGGSIATVQGNYYYFPPRDAYKYDYTPPSGVTRYELHFVDSNGTPYMREYNQAPTGVHYLTCNGTYEMQFFNSSQMVAKSPQMVTTAIQAPTCNSQPGTGTGYQDFTVTKTSNGDGSVTLSWSTVPGAMSYEVFKDGVGWGYQTDTSRQVVDDGSSYSVVAKDSSGNIIAQSDILPSSTPSPDPEPSNCDGCQFLKDMLACPEWDTYMGNLTTAIHNALPPPPDWDMVADKIGNAVIGKLSNYLGPVPPAPAVSEIDSNTHVELPTINNQPPEASMTPTVPADFNTPKPFDLSDAPVIDTTDSSKPFIITDPMSNVPHDNPGVPVLPGDPRNNNGGINQPVLPDTGGPATPGPVSGDPPPSPSGSPSDVPPTQMPRPSDPGGQVPIPSVPDSQIPIPGG